MPCPPPPPPAVSVLHKASEPAERQRIAAECGGAVSVTCDGYLCVDEGRLRNFQVAACPLPWY